MFPWQPIITPCVTYCWFVYVQYVRLADILALLCVWNEFELNCSSKGLLLVESLCSPVRICIRSIKFCGTKI